MFARFNSVLTFQQLLFTNFRWQAKRGDRSGRGEFHPSSPGSLAHSFLPIISSCLVLEQCCGLQCRSSSSRIVSHVSVRARANAYRMVNYPPRPLDQSGVQWNLFVQLIDSLPSDHFEQVDLCQSLTKDDL